MPSEIKRLLEQIEEEHLACRRGLTGLASGTARHEFINKKQQQIDLHHGRLIELIGPTATERVAEILESADLLFDCEQAGLDVQQPGQRRIYYLEGVHYVDTNRSQQ